jgi:hypothetical protein
MLPLLISAVSAIAGSSMLGNIIKNMAGGESNITTTTPTPTPLIYTPTAIPQPTGNLTPQQTQTAVNGIVSFASSQQNTSTQNTVQYPAPLPYNPTGYEELAYYQAVLAFYVSLGAPPYGKKAEANEWWAQYEDEYMYAYNDYWNAIGLIQMFSTPGSNLSETQNQDKAAYNEQIANTQKNQNDAKNLATAKNLIFSVASKII